MASFRVRPISQAYRNALTPRKKPGVAGFAAAPQARPSSPVSALAAAYAPVSRSSGHPMPPAAGTPAAWINSAITAGDPAPGSHWPTYPHLDQPVEGNSIADFNAANEGVATGGHYNPDLPWPYYAPEPYTGDNPNAMYDGNFVPGQGFTNSQSYWIWQQWNPPSGSGIAAETPVSAAAISQQQLAGNPAALTANAAQLRREQERRIAASQAARAQMEAARIQQQASSVRPQASSLRPTSSVNTSGMSGAERLALLYAIRQNAQLPYGGVGGSSARPPGTIATSTGWATPPGSARR